MKLSTKRASKKSISDILNAFEANRKAGIAEFVGGKNVKGSYSYQDSYGDWINVSTTNVAESLYAQDIDESNINTVNVERVSSHKKLLSTAIARNEAAVADKRFANVNTGHGGIKRPVRVYNTKTKTSTTVDSAYAAAELIGVTRDTVRNRLDGFVKSNKIGNYTVSYSYSL